MKIDSYLHIALASILLAACGSAVDFVDDDGSTTDAPGDDAIDVVEETAPDAVDDPADDPAPDAAPDGTSGECGNGSVEGGEDCDDGNDVDGDGCDSDCTWSCERNWE
jgi:cysteine-rich repeat protein